MVYSRVQNWEPNTMSTHTSGCRELPELLTAAEVLAAIRLTHVNPAQALYRLRKTRRLTGLRIGKQFKYRREDVVRLLSGASA
jgi:hypothetical protein